ncbi:MAG: hybrid sensor histidine kinase/response regulator, partial [Bacteroidaceae bacterium]|nr:hybrid sensor histidine kinase/response regulator [Bacteroidaceae bacterium]
MKNMIRIFTTILMFSLLTFLPLQASVEIISKQLTTGNGIADNSIRYVFQDSKGFIWMATLNGLSRYDGNSFVSFRPEPGKMSLSDHRIAKLYEDKNGFLWMATTPNLYNCYDLKRDCFVDFTGCSEHTQYYKDLLETSDGDIWLWLDGNGCRKVMYHDGTFSSEVYKKEKGNLPSDRVVYIYEDSRHRIWAGTMDGIAELVGDKFVMRGEGHAAFHAMEYDG